MTTTRNSHPVADQALVVALETCANEPIHRIGAIQPVGVPLAVDKDHYVIRCASANLDTIFPMTAHEAMDKPLAELQGNAQFERFRALVGQSDWGDARIWSISLPCMGRHVKYDSQVFRSRDLLVIEVEQQQPDASDVFHDLFIPVRDVLWKLDSERDLIPYAQKSVDFARPMPVSDLEQWLELPHKT